MLVPIAMIIIVLSVAFIGAVSAGLRPYKSEKSTSNERPNDREPTADPDLSNPPLPQTTPFSRFHAGHN